MTMTMTEHALTRRVCDVRHHVAVFAENASMGGYDHAKTDPDYREAMRLLDELIEYFKAR